MRRAVWVPVLAVAVLLGGVSAKAWADSSANDAFGAVRVASLDQAKARAMAWLKDVNADPATLQRAEEIWSAAKDTPVLDRVAETFMLVDAEAKELIESARDLQAPAPTAVPHVFVDSTKPMFFRANLGLYFAKLIGQRKVYPECLATLKAFSAEDTVDPATYYFFKAVAANKLRFKQEGLTAVKSLDQIEGAPERYTVVGNLMAAEMAQWKDQDLGDIARRMKEVEDRLEIARGGSVTKVKQDEIVDLLDKMIKALEEQCWQGGGSAGSAGGPPNGNRSSGPAADSAPAKGAGEGNIDDAKLVKDLKVWGSLPEKDRIKAIRAIEKKYPPEIADAIRGYLLKERLIPSGE